MALQKKNAELSYDARSNFGGKGWWVIIFAAMNFFMYANLNSAGLNVLYPVKAAELGVDQGILASWSTPAGILSLLLVIVIFQPLVKKFGVRKVGTINLIIYAAVCLWWGLSSSYTSYIFAVFFGFIMMNNMQYANCTVAVTNWFPKKKGIAMGWATIGLNISSACIVAIFTAVGLRTGMIGMAIGLVILGVINWFAFRDYPEEWGGYPDNDPNEKRKTEHVVKTGWTVGKVLKQKETWLCGIITAAASLVVVGFISTLVQSMILKGLSPETGILMMTVTSVCGAIGSYVTGWLDQKLGSQKALVVFTIWLIIGVVLFFIPGTTVAWIHCVVVGCALGGANNFPPSISAQIYGREGVHVAYPVINFICGLGMYAPHLLLGQFLAKTGSYNGGWLVMGIVLVISLILIFFTNFNPKPDPIDSVDQASAKEEATA